MPDRAPLPLQALIADDEPLLREHLQTHLARLWPELVVVAQARNGREAVELFDTHAPQLVFLDIELGNRGDGFDLLARLARPPLIVFVMIVGVSVHIVTHRNR